MKVREIMTEELATVGPDTTLEEIATVMRDGDTGAVPVVDEEALVGLITDRDIVIRCIAEGKDPAETMADEIISEDLETVAPEDDVEEAAQLMSSRQIRRLPVVEGGRLVGMLSLGDIAVKAGERQAGGALEEVSRGVKPSRHGGESQVKGRRRAVISPEQRLEQERGASRLISGGGQAGQGIANRSVSEEEARQARVVPIRNEGKTTRKRRAS